MITPELISAADASTAKTSVQLDLGDEREYAIAVSFSSATLAGSLKLQGSVDNVLYADIDNSTKSVVAGGAIIYSVSGAGYRYAKVVWTPSAGTGTLTAKAFVKQPTNRY